MKKFLALLLCVVLLASVIPAAAYADVDLQPAYRALDHLYTAYAKFGGATVYANGHDLIDLAMSFLSSSDTEEMFQKTNVVSLLATDIVQEAISQYAKDNNIRGLGSLVFLYAAATVAITLDKVGFPSALAKTIKNNVTNIDISSDLIDLLTFNSGTSYEGLFERFGPYINIGYDITADAQEALTAQLYLAMADAINTASAELANQVAADANALFAQQMPEMPEMPG